MASKPKKMRIDPRALRRSLGLNQKEFWGRVGVTQSGGSRYECSRAMSPPVTMLVDLIYVKGLDLSQIALGDVAILTFLKTEHPDLYTSLSMASGGVKRKSRTTDACNTANPS